MALPGLQTFMLLGAILSPLGLSACTSTGGEAVSGLAMTSEAGAALPDTVAVVPTSFAVDPKAPAVADAAAKPDAPVVAAVAGKPATPAMADVAAVRGAAPTATEVTQAAFTPNAFAKADKPQSNLDGLIAEYAAVYDVPVDLVRRVVKRESNFNPAARSKSYWGLMQISHATARGMGYDGPAKGLLDAETNLKYAVKYLRGAWLVSGGNHDLAVRFYARGYYYDAKRKGLLDETGLGTDRRRRMASNS